ncbi:hypothetical protein GSbR_31230 [Geobacter sp. SVR]|nr:hypothetical protein GSVR_03760 [Geobacter sp. SVR]GCF86523.1 hypothetical protein GSbR_31230 [Geobacter sp. SVR]
MGALRGIADRCPISAEGEASRRQKTGTVESGDAAIMAGGEPVDPGTVMIARAG